MHTVSTHPLAWVRRVRDAVPVRPLGSGLALVAFMAVWLVAGIPAHVPGWSLAAVAFIGARGVQLAVHAAVVTSRGVRRGSHR